MTLPTVLLAGQQDRGVLRNLLRAGEVVRVRRGAYALAAGGRAPVGGRREHALQRIAAVSSQLEVDMCVSHASAAEVWGLPLLRRSDVTHVTQRSRPGGERRDRAVQRHVGTIPQEDVTSIDGVRVTVLARTALDCIRSMPPVEGLVVLDAALMAGVDADSLVRRLAGLAGHRGVARARRVVGLARCGAESPKESEVRFHLVTRGIPEPVLQVAVRTSMGSFRLDMGWPDLGVGLEFDGWVKYGELAAGDPGRVVQQEKRRQRALEEAGWTIIRVTQADLRDPVRLARWVGSILERARSVRRVEVGT